MTIASECRICRDIPERAEWVPQACQQLVKLVGGEDDLWKCSLCGAYYAYSYAHYPGDGYTCDPYTDESVTRLEPAQAIDWIRRRQNELPFEPLLDHELEQLLVDHPVPEEPTATLISRLEQGHDAGGRAAWWLGRRQAGEAIPALAALLASADPSHAGEQIRIDILRAHAARALGSMGAAGAPALIAQLPGKPAAAYGLGHLARVDPSAAPAIQPALIARLAALGDSANTSYPANQEAKAIAWALGMTGYSDAAFAALAVLFQRSSLPVLMSEVVSRAFSRMGAVVVPRLIAMLGQDESAIGLALQTLTELGPAARDALPTLAAHPRATTPEFIRARAAITAPGPDPKTGLGRS